MDIHTFMTNYREAFGERAELPIAFWYCLLYTSDAADD